MRRDNPGLLSTNPQKPVGVEHSKDEGYVVLPSREYSGLSGRLKKSMTSANLMTGTGDTGVQSRERFVLAVKSEKSS